MDAQMMYRGVSSCGILSEYSAPLVTTMHQGNIWVFLLPPPANRTAAKLDDHR